jgi:hypothetical protein
MHITVQATKRPGALPRPQHVPAHAEASYSMLPAPQAALGSLGAQGPSWMCRNTVFLALEYRQLPPDVTALLPLS